MCGEDVHCANSYRQKQELAIHHLLCALAFNLLCRPAIAFDSPPQLKPPVVIATPYIFVVSPEEIKKRLAPRLLEKATPIQWQTQTAVQSSAGLSVKLFPQCIEGTTNASEACPEAVKMSQGADKLPIWVTPPTFLTSEELILQNQIDALTQRVDALNKLIEFKRVVVCWPDPSADQIICSE